MDKLELIKEYLQAQACDAALWADPKTPLEAYVKHELRKLIAMIEDMSKDEILEQIKITRKCLDLDMTMN